MTVTADILVIGGGIAGISAAARLAPQARVIVLEREAHLAYHSTGRSAAIFVLNYGNATLRALNAASLPDLVDVLSPRGEMLLATKAQMPDLEAQLAAGDGLERLTPAQAQAMVPVIRADCVEAALFEPDAQDIDVDRLLQSTAREARDHGAQIVTGAPVTTIASSGGAWQVEAGERYEAPVVINAAGAWADALAQIAGVAPIGLQPMRRSAVIMPVEAQGWRDWPMVGGIAEDWYAKPEATGLMISPADEDAVPAQDIHADDMVLAHGLDRFSQMMDVPLRRPSHTWAGLRSFVADRSPVCGMAPDAPGFFWLAGQGGYGVQTSPALSQLAADLILGRLPALGAEVVTALSPDRLYAS